MSSVSVVIPCYKYGHFLEEAVSSVLDDQEGVDVRVLIIDDASPDDSADAAAKIAARDPRVEVLVHSTNKGNIATYNEGLLEWAQGDYTALVSADDRLTPGALRRARDLLDAHPEVGFVYGTALWFWQDQPVPHPRHSSGSNRDPPGDEARREARCHAGARARFERDYDAAVVAPRLLRLLDESQSTAAGPVRLAIGTGCSGTGGMRRGTEPAPIHLQPA